jgi:hypothetical protein
VRAQQLGTAQASQYGVNIVLQMMVGKTENTADLILTVEDKTGGRDDPRADNGAVPGGGAPGPEPEQGDDDAHQRNGDVMAVGGATDGNGLHRVGEVLLPDHTDRGTLGIAMSRD